MSKSKTEARTLDEWREIAALDEALRKMWNGDVEQSGRQTLCDRK